LHRIWALLAGAPVGVLAALAAGAGSWLALEIGAIAGALALALAVALAGRLASHEPERGGHLARAASVGLAAAPAAAFAWLSLQPGALVALAAVVAALAIRLLVATRAAGPGGGALRQLAAAAGALAGGALASLVAAGALAALAARGPDAAAAHERARYVYDVDAKVPLAPAPDCAPARASSEVLAAGASPALTEGGAVVWFDAPGPEGRRQIHRLDRRTGAARCWTCGEPGNSRRPRATPNGASLVFETDRHATAFSPANWELHLVSARGEAPRGSRRLTFDAAPDAFGFVDPGGRMLVWSSGAGGRYAVAAAALRSGHGGIVLGAPAPVVAGGAAWVAPLAWSPDARALVVVRGDPLGLDEAFAVDLATGREEKLGFGGARVAAASFSADGATLALATTRPAAAPSALPSALGFAVARVAALSAEETARRRGTGVRIGPPFADELPAVELGELASFGYPTGIALEPDARAFVIGQRRAGEAGIEERLVRVELDCGAR
jgi:hypothetical protein